MKLFLTIPIINLQLALALVAAISFAGCSPKSVSPPVTPSPNKSASGTIAWPSWAKSNPLPGWPHASAYGCWDDKIVFVVWSDFDTSAGGTGGPTMEGVYRASMTAESGTQVECECNTKDGVSGELEIRVDNNLMNDVPYDLEKGRLFLIRTRDTVPKVIQLNRTVFDLPVTIANEDMKSRLKELAINDKQINEFLTNRSDVRGSTN